MRVSPAYPLDSDKLKKDGVSLTAFAHHPYVNSLAEFVKESMIHFKARHLPGPEIVLDENSNSGATSSTPRDPRLQATPGTGGVSFDSSLTIPETYSTPQSQPVAVGPISGVSFWLFFAYFLGWRLIYLFLLAVLPGWALRRSFIGSWSLYG